MNAFVKNLVKSIIFALPAVALVAPMNMFFPFITGKAFLFRVAVELAFLLYIALAVSDKTYRPKWDALTIAFAIFTGVAFLADIFALNPGKALWSNFERMDGFVTVIHLFLYFIVASFVLKSRKDWKVWMLSVVAISVYMLFFCFLQLAGEAKINQGGVRVDGFLGNASYLAVYLLFHFFFLLYLWLSEKADFKGISTSLAVGGFGYAIYYLWRISHAGVLHTNLGLVIFIASLVLSGGALYFRFSERISDKWRSIFAHIVYGAIATSYLVVLYFTATRGAILGLIGGVFAGALFLAFKSEDTRTRNVGAGVLIGICVLVGGFYLAKDSSFVRNSPVLSRFASLSLDTKGQARNYIWPMALQGFTERPVLGWGQEGFNYVFQKYYVPEMITQEPWFDRAHNVFLDWLVAGGILGFFSYLSLYVLALIYIWRSDTLHAKEKAVLIALLIAYTFQNLFIFDNLLSYILFASLLAFLSARHKHSSDENVGDNSINMAVLASCIIGFIVVALLVNAKAYLQNINLIKAMNPQQLGLSQNLALFKKVIGYNSFGTYEAREHLIFSSIQVISSSNVSNEDKLTFANMTADEMDKQIKETPKDARAHLEFGDFLVTLGAYDQAIPILEKAKSFSPKKQQIAYALSRLYFGKGINSKDPKETAEGLSIMKGAYELAPNLDTSRIQYISALFLAGQVEDAVKIINEVEDPSSIIDRSFVKTLIANGHGADAINVLKKVISIDNQHADAYTLLADIYFYLKDSKNAIAILEDMGNAIPSRKSEADADIATVKESLK